MQLWYLLKSWAGGIVQLAKVIVQHTYVLQNRSNAKVYGHFRYIIISKNIQQSHDDKSTHFGTGNKVVLGWGGV